jgi:hypothetical protein
MVLCTECTPALSMTQSDQVIPGQSYDPLLMSPVKSSSISVDEREESTETWIVYVCNSGWMGKTKDWSAFERGMVVSRTAMLLGFSRSTVSRVYQEWSTTQRTPSQLDTTVGSIGVNMGQHPCGMLSTACRVHAPTKWRCSECKRGKTQ